MTGEWQVERLDLDAYLARIGFPGDLDVTGPTLGDLHRAHVARIPFENIDVRQGGGVETGLDAVQDKLVRHRRGGYCYEHGVLFAAALDRIGFDVDRLLARIGHDAARPRPRTHMLLHVRSDQQQWLADVGFGGGLLWPLPWDDVGAIHRQGGWTYRLEQGTTGERMLLERHGEQWRTLYSFTDEPQHASDITMANHFTQSHPSSPFRDHLVAIAKDEARLSVLRGRRLTQTRPGGTSTEDNLERDQFHPVLTEIGIHVSHAQAVKLWRDEGP
ncbi:arylamine N-acetyltransferase family protein [Solicola gregarius]|uniref:Arylamine N-acetyltransferase n=1 Tax=Solicola gregarius TaxID=2908642 RepID=A0AA46TJM2_9ACTN|nr:arylamine N-acetyltransferase [Solicola gregarius]UYM06305.1 arylamine N-acetyltransferase [Solicola gregarius]